MRQALWGPPAQNIDNVRYRTLSFFFMGMMAVMTLVIQGSTTGLLLQVASPVRDVNACRSTPRNNHLRR